MCRVAPTADPNALLLIPSCKESAYFFSALDSPSPLLEDAIRILLTTPKRQKPVLCLIQYELLCSVGLSI